MVEGDMQHSYQCEYGRIMLCPLESQDIEELKILRNKKRKYFLTQDEISADSQREWYERYLQKANDYMFKIVRKGYDSEFIGAIALYDIDNLSKSAEFGRLIIDKDKCKEKGLGTEAVRAISLLGFNELKLSKIHAEVLQDNMAAIISYKRAGYEIIDDSRKDVFLMERVNVKEA